MKTFRIRVNYGGLGDHLFHSHLPRIAKEHGGFDRVLVSRASPFRDDDYRKLVWELNPYVDGFCDEDAPCPEFAEVPAGMNILDWIMLERGLDDGRRGHEPELHYRPKPIAELAGATVFDPNFVSYVGDIDAGAITRYFEEQKISVAGVLAPRPGALWTGGAARVLRPGDVFEYCDMVASAKEFLCLTSGGATLAAALGRPVTAFHGPGQKPMFHHSGLHRYVCLEATPTAVPALSVNDAEFAQFADRLAAFLDPGSVRVALDVGSRDGEIALKLAAHFPHARVFAFECNPDALPLCRRHLAGHDRITLVECAVSDECGPVDFFAIDPARTVTPHADGNIGASSLFQANGNYPHEQYIQNRVSVPATTLDAWADAAGIPAIDVIWMDLQGAELKALRGMGARLDRLRALYTEVEYREIYAGQPLFGDLDQYLRSHGFRLAAQFNTSEWSGDALYVARALKSMPKPLRWLRRLPICAR
ncbi:MAG: FkbM family methyltransferase [Chthoniobacter sp.]|nr:FkbM family methyltransferase [Chthoniobacter sp.]